MNNDLEVIQNFRNTYKKEIKPYWQTNFEKSKTKFMINYFDNIDNIESIDKRFGYLVSTKVWTEILVRKLMDEILFDNIENTINIFEVNLNQLELSVKTNNILF